MEIFLDGINEQLKVTEKTLTITRKKLLALVIHGFKGNKTISVANITDIKVKKATYLLSGQMQIHVTDNGKQLRDVIRFKAAANEAAEQIAAFVAHTNAGKKFHGKIQFDSAVELLKYKQLLQAEIITPEEFAQLEELIVGIGRRSEG